jgi:hypothetical protein
MIPAFQYGYNQADRTMQFLVYLTVLMVSVSTILLEMHWLTSPAPPLKPAIQATSASPPTPKIEGPNAALSPVYPKKADAPPPADLRPTFNCRLRWQFLKRRPYRDLGQRFYGAAGCTPQSTAAATPPQRPAAETTGTVARDDDDNRLLVQRTCRTVLYETAAVPSGNRCDIQACAGAYKSFRASDCTYQSFEGPRRVCGKSPVQRAAREQRDEPERRKLSRNAYPPDLDRSTVGRRIDDDDDESVADFDDESDQIVIRRLGRRW